jgi:hypothetical protein
MSFQFRKGDIVKPKDEYKDQPWYHKYIMPYRKVIKVNNDNYFRLSRQRNDKPEEDFTSVYSEYFELAVRRPEPVGATDLIQEILGLLTVKESELRQSEIRSTALYDGQPI